MKEPQAWCWHGGREPPSRPPLHSADTSILRFLKFWPLDSSKVRGFLFPGISDNTGLSPASDRGNQAQISFRKIGVFFFPPVSLYKAFPGGASGKEPGCQCRRPKSHRFHPWVGRIPWRRAWQSTLVFLPGESHGQRSLAGYRSLGRKESDTTEAV